jgi:hypothetical protein
MGYFAMSLGDGGRAMHGRTNAAHSIESLAKKSGDVLGAARHALLRMVHRVKESRSDAASARVALPASDDPDVDAAVQTISGISATTEVVRTLYRAVYAYERTGNVAALTQLAGDALATVRVHNLPGYDKAFRGAPDRPTGTGRPIDEIFTDLRRYSHASAWAGWARPASVA